MILSDGKNEFSNNEYSYWEWSVPVLQTYEEVVSGLAELKLEGRKVKNVRCVGMAYNWRDDGIADSVYNALDNISHEQRCELPNPGAFLPEGIYLPRSVEIDEPFLIEFEDGDVLGIDYSEGSSVRLGLNTIPENISFGTNSPTIHTDKLFEDIIGKEIVSVEITTSTTMPEFTGSHGLSLDEQPLYITGLNIRYAEDGLYNYQNSLFLTSYCDYGLVELKKYDGELMKIHAPDIKEVVKGFIEEEILNLQEEFDLTEFED